MDDTVRIERDLYLRLLELGTCGDLAKLLDEALQLIVEVTRAEKGYLALFDERGDEPRFAIVKGLRPDELSGVRRTVSTGVVAAALSTGRTIVTESAIDDPRFSDNRSVQLAHIGAVLCAPIGSEGVIYLQADERFDDHDRTRAETFTRHLAPFVDRLSSRRAYEQRSDPTAPLRARMRLDGIVGRSAGLAAVLAEVEGAARFDISVLLRGSTGTGKAALARAIHDNSPRAGKPFIEINCSTVPEALLDGELFGIAASTATRRQFGKLAAAEGGTIFLDEVGELGAAVQGKLLQLLQAREYYPVGASLPERADVRLLAATSANLEAAVREKRLREDLYYRLVVLAIAVPDLDARSEDLAPLARHFCALACANHKLPTLSLSPSAVRAIESAEWPGNIRQLAHAIETAAIRAAVAKSPTIEIRHVFGDVRAESSAPATYQEATRKFQRQLVAKTLEDTGWNVTEAARRLGLSRAHVHNLITTFELNT